MLRFEIEKACFDRAKVKQAVSFELFELSLVRSVFIISRNSIYFQQER
jgi:hypothetical protein